MKRASLILILFLILMEVKMPVNQILKEEQGNKQTYKPAAFKPGAVQSGTVKKPAWTDAITSAAAATNTGGGGSWLTMDNQPAPQPAFVNPPPAPAWIKNVADSVAAVNTNGSGQWWTMNGQPAQQPSFAKTAPQPVIAVGQALAPVQPKWLNPYKGEPVNDSYSDTLRSMTPETNTTPVSQPTPVTAPVVVPPPTGYTPPAWYSYKPRGFGSSYGGNWGSGGGYSSGYSPYYSNQMGLYNWQFGG